MCHSKQSYHDHGLEVDRKTNTSSQTGDQVLGTFVVNEKKHPIKVHLAPEDHLTPPSPTTCGGGVKNLSNIFGDDTEVEFRIISWPATVNSGPLHIGIKGSIKLTKRVKKPKKTQNCYSSMSRSQIFTRWCFSFTTLFHFIMLRLLNQVCETDRGFRLYYKMESECVQRTLMHGILNTRVTIDVESQWMVI